MLVHDYKLEVKLTYLIKTIVRGNHLYFFIMDILFKHINREPFFLQMISFAFNSSTLQIYIYTRVTMYTFKVSHIKQKHYIFYMKRISMHLIEDKKVQAEAYKVAFNELEYHSCLEQNRFFSWAAKTWKLGNTNDSRYKHGLPFITVLWHNHYETANSLFTRCFMEAIHCLHCTCRSFMCIKIEVHLKSGSKDNRKIFCAQLTIRNRIKDLMLGRIL